MASATGRAAKNVANQTGSFVMSKFTMSIVFALMAALALSSCSNTMRGAGNDMSNNTDMSNTKSAPEKSGY